MIYFVVGVRPHYVKAKALLRCIDGSAISHRITIVDIAQHYDDQLRGQYAYDLGARLNAMRPIGPPPSLGSLIDGLIGWLGDHRSPGDAVLVTGDANPAMVGAVAARQLAMPLGHWEAGVRRVADEVEHWNAILADHLSSVRICYSRAEERQLQSEGLITGNYVAGDISTKWTRHQCAQLIGVEPRRLLVTLHRPQNCNPQVLRPLIAQVQSIGVDFIWITHPRTATVLSELVDPACLLPPQPHDRLLALLANAPAVLTDSGGLTREALVVGRPCVVLHGNGMWTGAVKRGGLILAQSPHDVARLTSEAMGQSSAPDAAFDVSTGLEIFKQGLLRLESAQS